LRTQIDRDRPRAEEGRRMALYIVVNVAIVVALGILARLIGR